ncbi:Biotin synthase [Durusdinium trenchii]|uniref:Mitochondrial n=1 Tax=Durusdinium trenchii TaxID=1381693 RepID=A0ABP0HQS0_9DINO
MVKGVHAMGMEPCVTTGFVSELQAQQLKEAGLHSLNHNLDTSERMYPKIISTRTFDQRLETINNAAEAGLNVCTGGIVGLGEETEDRIELLRTLANLPSGHPDSVPVNSLIPIEGTPLGDRLKKTGKAPTWVDLVRMIATARILMPKTMVRLSAGRHERSEAEQAMMVLCGGNSIFSGELLTTDGTDRDRDAELFELLGLKSKPPNSEALRSPYMESNP